MPCTNCGHGSSTPTGAVDAARIQTPETTEVRSWTELPLLDTSDIPDDLDLIGGSNKKYQAWRIPAAHFLPGGAMNLAQYNIASDAIELPERQVVPVYTNLNQSTGFAVLEKALAVTGETATDIAVAAEDGVVTLQKNGYYKFTRPHMYEIGATYYLSQTTPGEVVSVRPSAGIIQPLFSVVDHNTISINVNLY